MGPPLVGGYECELEDGQLSSRVVVVLGGGEHLSTSLPTSPDLLAFLDKAPRKRDDPSHWSAWSGDASCQICAIALVPAHGLTQLRP